MDTNISPNRLAEMELLADIGYRNEDEPIEAQITGAHLIVTLKDGRVISTPLEWYPSLKQADDKQRSHIELSAWGVHWPDLDEDLSIRGMLMGWKAVYHRPENFKPLIIDDLPEDERA